MKSPWLNNTAYYDENYNGWYCHNAKTGITSRINRQVGQSFMTEEEVKIENDYDTDIENTEFWDSTSCHITSRLATAYHTGALDRLQGGFPNNKYGEIAGYEAGIKATQAFYDGGYHGIDARDVVADRPLYFALPWFNAKEQMENFARCPFHIWSNYLPEKPKKTSKMALEEATEAI